MKKNIIRAGLVIAVLGFIAYSIGWFLLAAEITKQIDIIQTRAADSQIVIEGELSPVTGFPFRPQISFSGTATHQDDRLVIPYLFIKGFPVPTQSITVTLPQGAKVEGPAADSEILSLDYLQLRFIVPVKVPYAPTNESLTRWSADGGKFDVPEFKAQKQSLSINGSGLVELDSALQPQGHMDVTMTGHIAFLEFLQRKQFIDARAALMAGIVMNGFSTRDETTGESSLNASLSLRDRRLSLGPLEIFSLPPVVWAQE